MLLGVDYAWGGPPPISVLRGIGASFVGRYFSLDESKNISQAEYAELTRAGIEVVVVWETSADRAKEGGDAGYSDALNAEHQRRGCGMPDTQVIHFAVDFPALGSEVEDYFRGAEGQLGPRTGAYAGYGAMSHLFDQGLISHGWQTYAWSNGRWHQDALVRQYSNGHVLAGVQCDYDVKLTDPIQRPPATDLDVLLEPERDAADAYVAYKRNPGAHTHGLEVVGEELVRFRKQVWVAAVRGILPSGRPTEPGWRRFNRDLRYRVLWSLTN
jgi:Domain of unknown function (DUF1906)